jgi:hypothetical protein
MCSDVLWWRGKRKKRRGGEIEGAEPPPPADGRSRGSAAPHPPRAADAAARGTERSRVGARVLLGAVLSQRERRWTVGLNPTASRARCWLPGRWAVSGWAHRASCGCCLPHSALVGCGPPVCDRKMFFSVLFFRIQFFDDFVQILTNFHTVNSIQNIPTKILCREFKSYRNFSIKFKGYEFLFMFSLHIVKVIA